MIGAIIGDVVGSRFEFNNHRSTKFKLFTENSFFTDDTVCTIATAEWIKQTDDYGLPSAKRYEALLRKWCLKYPNESYGGMFLRWLASENPKPYNSFGNGAGMRISPIGDIYGNLDAVLEYSDMVTGVTHNHPEGLKGARAIAHAQFMGREGKSKAEIKTTIEKVYDYDLSAKCDEIRAVNVFDETSPVTVPQAIIAFLESTDFESAIRLAISIGGDSDTIAAMTGGIAECFYQEIPRRMIFETMSRLPEEIRAVVYDHYHKLRLEQPAIFSDLYDVI